MNDGTSSLFSSLKGLNLNKILNTANRTLNFVNKALPMYKEIKPTFSNLKNLISPNKDEIKNTIDEIKESRPIKIKKSIPSNNTNNDRNTVNNDTLKFFQ